MTTRAHAFALDVIANAESGVGTQFAGTDVLELARAYVGMGWQPIESAPRDGREILAVECGIIRVCRPKAFPRPILWGDDLSVSKPGDRWEWFREDDTVPGHTWSMHPTHWMPLPPPPSEGRDG